MTHSEPEFEGMAIYGRSYSLNRYPADKTGTLRAWDAADNYLLETLSDELGGSLDRKNILILNDNFGALTLPLIDRTGEGKIVSYGDSWMSRNAIEQNAALNELKGNVRYSANIAELCVGAWTPDVVIGRVPKSKSHLAYLLSMLREKVSDDCLLYLSGMDKHLSKGQYDLLEQFFGPAKFFPGLKKARVWSAKVDKSLRELYQFPKLVELPDFGLSLSALPNVFCADKLDIGSRFFLDNLAKLPVKKRVADLACGAGVLGLCYLSRHPGVHLSFFDESFQALQSTQANIGQMDSHIKADFHVGDGLKSAEDKCFDLILCNPPFHQQNTINKQIANSFFKDAKRCLDDGGELWIVANRHLGYHVVLKRLFKQVETVVGNKKFVILRACKQT